ncbi:cytochrome P450 94B3-like [Cucurbita maxima]|uniref:Cytochrome P450 94B3-like n=1 Tax=Cucurbita maxima TaxID=3661 RepID=A0A6J1JKB3_CUCMA|nr:cytochrome P450 94B3-like [Cucurbita maxima]
MGIQMDDKWERKLPFGFDRENLRHVQLEQCIQGENYTVVIEEDWLYSSKWLISVGHDDKIIRDMAISFIMAGRDMTLAAMTGLFWLLTHHSNVEKPLVEEIDLESTLILEKKFDYKSLEELKFLKACLCETMRLYPPVPVPWDSKHAIVNDWLPDGTPVQAGDKSDIFPIWDG